MRALVLTTSYPVVPGILSGSFVRDLLRGLAARGWEFEVVTPALAGSVAGGGEPSIAVHPALSPGAGWRGGLAHRRGLPEALAAEPWKWALVPGMLLAMRAAAERRLDRARGGRRFDLVWSHWLFPSGVLGAGLARRHRLPHAITAHGADVHLLERLGAVPGARSLLARQWDRTRLSAPAEITARRIERALGRRYVHVVPLLAGARPSRPRENRPPAAVRLMFLGRFEPIKGPDRLLEACARVASPDLDRVVLAGAGSLERSLRDRASTLAHPVAFAGMLEGDAKHEAVARAHLMVLPSRRLRDGRGEGLPHAAMEAFAAGTPVIAPAGGALGDLIARTGAGATFEDGVSESETVARLARTIASLASSPARLAAHAARAREAGRAFAAHRVLPAWDEFLGARAGESA